MLQRVAADYQIVAFGNRDFVNCIRQLQDICNTIPRIVHQLTFAPCLDELSQKSSVSTSEIEHTQAEWSSPRESGHNPI